MSLAAIMAIWLAVLAPMNAPAFPRHQPVPCEQTSLAACVMMGPRKLRGRDSKGFTLIELSIVLVIIGLIVGGVFVGQDLIRAAKVRATVSQYERFNAATNTFKTKYNCLPGDCATATQFGFTGLGINTGSVNGDGNGQILGGSEGYWTEPDTAVPADTESLQYWNHLKQAGLISDYWGGRATGNPCAQSEPGAISPTAPIISTYIDTGCGQGKEQVGGWALFHSSGTNANSSATLQFSGHIYVLTDTLWCCSSGKIVTPADSQAVDTKIDDGMPTTGIVRAFGGNVINQLYSPTAGAAGSSNCLNNSVTPYAYNTTNGNYLCALVLQATF